MTHKNRVLEIIVPTVTGPTKFRLKAEKDAEAYVWLAVITQSNKVREKKIREKKTDGKGNKPERQTLEMLSESYDDYEI